VNSNSSTIQIGNEKLPVIGRRSVNGRTYLLLEELSASGHGGRFRAFDQSAGLHGEQRRLLVIPRNGYADRQLRVLQRTRRHDHLFAHILDLQRCRNEYLVVMDWVPGPTLRTYLTEVRAGRVERPSVREAFRLGRDLARNLSKLHRLSFVVHGDLHPGNLILQRDSSRLVLIDFGSAWCLESSARRLLGDGLQSVYSAPEMHDAGQSPLEFADQFVATLILYEMLTLVVPYEGLGGKAGWPEHREELADLLVPPSKLHPHFDQVPAAVRDGINCLAARALSLSPSQRYPTNNAWLAEYDRVWFAMNRPSEPSGFNDRVSKWIAQLASWVGVKAPDTSE
jgi:serine/threonine protein kinase